MAKRRDAEQLDLKLRLAPRWGGRREGAGRKRGMKPSDPHRPRPVLETCLPCHVTLKVVRGLPSLRSVRLVRELERSLAEACGRERFRVTHYAIQPDHVHLIVEADSRTELASGMKAVGARLARAVNRVFCRRGRVLSDRYHLHVLRTPREVRHALAYLLMNARRHLAKLGRRLPRAVWLDPASSARWFDGWRRELEIELCPRTPTERPPVATPRTWLLRVGWRRHGLLDPTEIPGGSGWSQAG